MIRTCWLLPFRAQGLGLAVLLVLTAGSLRGETPAADVAAPSDTQCGHWAILRCAEILGVPVAMDSIRRAVPYSERGHSMLTLKDAIEQIGLHCEGRQETLDELRARGFPAIVHLNRDHFVVIAATDGRVTVIFDGRGRRQLIGVDDLLKQWTGKALHVWRQESDLPLPRGPAGVSQAAPRIQMDTLFLDKGEVPSVGEPVEFSFPFRNLGAADLVVDKAITNCSCLESICPDRPIAPGASGTVRLRYRVPNAGGPFVYAAAVRTNDPVVPVLRLQAAANANRRVVVQPDFLELGSIPAGERRVSTVVLWSSGDQPLAVSRVETDIDAVSVRYRVVDAGTLRGHLTHTHSDVLTVPGAQAMILSFEPESQVAGKLLGTIYIHTSIAGFERISVPLRLEVRPFVSLRPGLLFLADVPPGRSFRRTVWLVGGTEGPLRVLHVDVGGTGLTYELRADTPHWPRVVFSGTLDDPSRLSGNRVSIEVRVGDHGTRVVDLPIAVDERAPADKSGAPPSGAGD